MDESIEIDMTTLANKKVEEQEKALFEGILAIIESLTSLTFLYSVRNNAPLYASNIRTVLLKSSHPLLISNSLGITHFQKLL